MNADIMIFLNNFKDIIIRPEEREEHERQLAAKQRQIKE